VTVQAVTAQAGWWYAGYIAWLLAGLADFICHRRTDIANTSGVLESSLHLIQICIIGTALVLWLAFVPSLGLVLSIGILVVLHAVAGYTDTRVAYRVREIRPFEQHLHSVLDVAPWIGFVALVVSFDQQVGTGAHNFELRRPMLPVAVWIAILIPGMVFILTPAALELLQAIGAGRRKARA
jgi:hypothetical protein